MTSTESKPTSPTLDEQLAALLAADPKLAATRDALRETLLQAHWIVREDKPVDPESLK